MSSSWSRMGIATLGLFGLAGCAEVETVKAPIDIPSRIYTANESSNDVSVIDATTYATVGSIDSRNQSTHDLAVSRDGRRVYATNLASGRLSVMDAAMD